MAQRIKIVVVGDGGVGKSCLIMTYSTNRFPSHEYDYVPTVCGEYYRDYTVNGIISRLHVLDTVGQDDYCHFRCLSYPLTDVFILCFDISNQDSFTNVKDKWVPELRQHMPETPILLAATKTDLRSQRSDSGLVLAAEARKIAEELGLEYVECSAMTQEGVKNVFETAICKTLCRCCQMKRKHGFFRRLFNSVFRSKPRRPNIRFYKPDNQLTEEFE